MVFMGGAGGISVANAQEHNSEERLLKAAYIFNFAKFTSWPENVWSDAEAPLTLCTIGKDSLISELKRLDGKMIKGHPVSIQHIKGGQISNECQLLYIATSEVKRVHNIIKTITKRPILTVSEIPDFVTSGGIAELLIDKGHLRFKFNLANARESGLVISSRLLKLAISVISEDES